MASFCLLLVAVLGRVSGSLIKRPYTRLSVSSSLPLLLAANELEEGRLVSRYVESVCSPCASPPLAFARCGAPSPACASQGRNLRSGRRIGALRSACPCTPPVAVLVGLLTRCGGSARQGYNERLRRPCLWLAAAVVVGLPRGGRCGAPLRPRMPRSYPLRGLAARSRSRPPRYKALGSLAARISVTLRRALVARPLLAAAGALRPCPCRRPPARRRFIPPPCRCGLRPPQ